MRRVLVSGFSVFAGLAVFALAASALAAPAGGGAEDRFRQAGAAYEAGRWEDAASMYAALLADGYDDARVHYNLGNALFKQGRLGPAILEYERALARHPSDADAKENLAYANLLTVDKVGPEEETLPEKALARLRQAFGPDRATAFFAGFFALAGALGAALWFRPRPGAALGLRVALGAAILGALLSGGLLALELSRAGGSHHAIVMAPTVDGRSAPASDGTVLFTVHEGLKVEVRSERQGWVQVALPNGLVGWIESTKAERI